MGPPFRKLSIKKLEPSPLGVVGASLGDGLSVAVTVAVGEVTAPGDAGAAGPPGGKFAVGSCAGAAGFASAGAAGLAGAGAAGLAGAGATGLPVVGTPGADFCGGAGDCASEVSASASEHRQAVSNVFIIEGVW
jgi:hypothetical protein